MSRLLLRLGCLPGESLPSFVRRLAIWNGYDPPGILHQLCRAGLRDRHFVTPCPPLLSRLAYLSNRDAAALYSHSAHPLAALLTPPEIAIETVQLAG